MLNTAARPFVKLVERFLPDPFIFVLILTAIVLVCAVVFQQQPVLTALNQWGDGFWGLLGFSMQMLLVLVSGHMLASTRVVKAALDKIATTARTPGKAIILITLVSMLASWLNWGFGLVVGALFAKALARRVDVDYRLLVASAYSGFLVWHGGLAGSVPLTIATPGHFTVEQIGVIGTGETLFSAMNLTLLGILLVVLPLVNRAMLPKQSESVIVDKTALKEAPVDTSEAQRPAEKLEKSPLLAMLIGFAGIAYLINYFVGGGTLNLNIINFLFLFLAMVLHGTPERLLSSLQQAIQGTTGIVLQFPFYAGIMAVMVESGLARDLSQWLISFATVDTLALWSFISAGLVNMFVPSGGGQWAVQAPVILPAAMELGTDVSKVAMAVAWGDAWTNLVQPFWALPVLAIAGLKAKDMMGFCLVQLIITGLIISTVLLTF
ncbi:short-chain fatty acid transporter [Alteromonas halophila]|uniref:Short-chain fatty acid transporter n=1 Tax=Alteromonas halophila TaxID=516698 RepID=A0A918JCY9_9ALTE|nr:TIGR00366 family protein [Alteromonas halophila]GGW72975.1 short-chain fatty acid transporter [Alteromonas halophila]